MEDLWWHGIAIVFLLGITLIPALFPIYIANKENQLLLNEARPKLSQWKSFLTNEFSYLTGGVFMGAGFLHLLPDAEAKYRLYFGNDVPEYPWIYVLSLVGCSAIWAIDTIQLGNSGKMIAVAAAATPAGGASICVVRVPSMATYGARGPKLVASKDSLADYEAICCKTVPSPTHAIFSKISEAGASRLFSQQGTFGHYNSHSKRFMLDDLISDAEDSAQSTQHSHVDSASTQHVVFSGESTLLPFILAGLFSVHSLIAGFTLGVSTSLDRSAVATYLAIISHKFIEAMSVGSNFVKENVSTTKSIAVIVMYSFMTPLGIVLGMALTASLTSNSAILTQSIAMAIASGSFMYLSFHEISENENNLSALSRIFWFFTGNLLMALVAIYT